MAKDTTDQKPVMSHPDKIKTINTRNKLNT